MAHELPNNEVREIAADLGKVIEKAQRYSKRAPSRELSLSITNIEQGFMWLKKIGHDSYLDTGKESPGGESE